MMAASERSNNDCCFYLKFSCNKDKCLYRHSEAARCTEIVCSAWLKGQCFRSDCEFRHMENRKTKSIIQCIYENRPGGCRKPYCVYLHRKLRKNIYSISRNQRLKLPISTGTFSPRPKGMDSKDQAITEPSENYSNHGDDANMNPQTVEPFVVSIDEENPVNNFEQNKIAKLLSESDEYYQTGSVLKFDTIPVSDNSSGYQKEKKVLVRKSASCVEIYDQHQKFYKQISADSYIKGNGADLEKFSSSDNTINSLPNHKPALPNNFCNTPNIHGSNSTPVPPCKKAKRLHEAKSNGGLQIKRHSAESAMNNGILNQVPHDGESLKRKNHSKMILRDVQNISEYETSMIKAPTKKLYNPSGQNACSVSSMDNGHNKFAGTSSVDEFLMAYL